VKSCVVFLAVASATSSTCQVAASQNGAAAISTEAKHIVVPVPKGLINAEANEVDKDWASHIVHLKGNAYVRIYTVNKDPRGAINLRADEVYINESSGEISPQGNVRLNVDEIK
jgi:lipopolysaccharide export system protein LptA